MFDNFPVDRVLHAFATGDADPSEFIKAEAGLTAGDEEQVTKIYRATIAALDEELKAV